MFVQNLVDRSPVHMPFESLNHDLNRLNLEKNYLMIHHYRVAHLNLSPNNIVWHHQELHKNVYYQLIMI